MTRSSRPSQERRRCRETKGSGYATTESTGTRRSTTGTITKES